MKSTERNTIFSPCRKYRYCLWREWDMIDHSYAAFIGLNPSTADEIRDDPTVRRCIRYAKKWGFASLCMLNIFAFRATEPHVMREQAGPVGPENDRWIVECAENAGIIIAAWGVNGEHMNRGREVMSLLAGKLSCLGKTKNGSPKHPLYVKADVMPCKYV